MKKKIRKTYQDHGFGFPVTLMNVPMIEIRGELAPDVDQKELQEQIVNALVLKPARLTGNEIRFLRLFANMTLQEFAGRFAVSHPAVLKWEKSDNSATSMTWTTEKDIRLFVFSLLQPKAEKFLGVYKQLARVAPERAEGIRINLSKKTA